jgi:predicted ATPase
VAADLLNDFADGVYFVALASISDPAFVQTAIAQALVIREAGSQVLHPAIVQPGRVSSLTAFLNRALVPVSGARSDRLPTT